MTTVKASDRRSDHRALSGVRAVAAFAVIGTHVGFQSGHSLGNQPLGPFLARLNFGVTLFFLLSGFLLSQQFLTDTSRLSPSRLARFWWRRALRILPAYWLAIVGTMWWLSDKSFSVGDWVSYLTLSQTYDNHYTIESLSHTWTLVVELSFYLALPLLIWASRQIRRPRHQQMAALVSIMVVAALVDDVIIRTVRNGASPELLWLPAYLDWFGLGILLATLAAEPVATRWRRTLSEWARAPGTCWVVGALCFWLLTLPFAGPRTVTEGTTWEWTISHVLSGAAAFFFLLPLTQGGSAWTDSLLGNRFMTWLGEISYGVYLWHFGLLVAIGRWLNWPPFTGHFFELYGLTAGGAVAAAATSWYLVERPLLRRFSSSWRSVGRGDGASEHHADRDQSEQLHTGAAGQRVG